MKAPAPLLRIEVSEDLWHVTLNRPEQGNACSTELVSALDDAIARAQAECARAFVLRGEGRHFCTGFDLSKLDEETDGTLLARFVRIELMLQRLASAPFPTVAYAHGRAMGAGADLFTACEVRLAEARATFAFPGARGFGLVLGTRRLAARVGSETALSWVESACSVSADEACRRGLVTDLVQSPDAIHALLDARAHGDRALRSAVREAVTVQRRHEDARDLELLVRSAAQAGLRERIAAYVTRSAATRHLSSLPSRT